MVAPVSEDPEKALVAARLKQLLRDRGYTHQSFAAELEVSPGLVSQWATNRGTVPPDRAVAVAALLGVLPQEISPTWRLLRDQFEKSQSLQLDASTIRHAITLAKKAMRLGAGEELVIEHDPEVFAQALRAALATREQREKEHGIRYGSGDGEVGGASSASGAPEAREAARPAARKRKHA